MICIIAPSLADILSLQREESRYYWSAATEVLFRGEGWLSVCTSRAIIDAGMCGLVATRRTGLDLVRSSNSTFRFFEGPLAPEVASAFGIKVNHVTTRSVDLRWADGAAETVYYSEEHYLCPDTGNPKKASEPGWMAPGIVGQTFELTDGWVVHLSLMDPVTQELKPVLVSREGVFLCGLPIFDMAVRENAFPPIPGRYYSRDTTTGSNRIVQRVIQMLIAEHRKYSSAAPLLKIRRWPRGYQAALTVRHDYDRRITPRSIEELLDLYEDLGLKCSIGFLSYLAPKHDVRAFKARGHEIQCHSHGSNLASFGRTLAIVRHIADGDVRGATIHGGSTSIGFIGDTFFEWAELEGLEYVEGFFNATIAPASPIIRIGPAGIPAPSALMGARAHISLDTGTTPGSNQLETATISINSILKSGDHAILMNHPDLNRTELSYILRNADLENIWHATQFDVADWFRTTHFEASTVTTKGSVELVFPRTPREKAVVHLFWGGKSAEFLLSGICKARFVRRGDAIDQVDLGPPAALDLSRGTRLRARQGTLRIISGPRDSAVRRSVLEERLIVLDTFDDQSSCGPRCQELLNRWKSWFTHEYRAVQPPAELGMPSGETGLSTSPMAILEIPTSMADYLEAIGAESRDILRKAEHAGYTVRPYRAIDHLNDIHAMEWSHFVDDENTNSSRGPAYSTSGDIQPANECPIHLAKDIGCFIGERLVSCATIGILGEFAAIERISARAEHLSRGVLNLLVRGIVDHMQTCATVVRAVSAPSLHAARSGSDRFEASVGFAPRPVALLGKGLAGKTLPYQLDPFLEELHEPGSRIAYPPKEVPPYDEAYLERRFIGTTLRVGDHGGSGLRALLDLLELQNAGRALEVSQHSRNSSAGEATTVPLLKYFAGSVDIVEADPAACEVLRARFSPHVDIYESDFSEFRPCAKYDLILINVSPARVARNFYSIIRHASSMLTDAGKLIVGMVYDPAAIYGGASPLLSPAGREVQEMFLADLLSKEKAQIEDFRKALWPWGFAAIGLVDKWMGRGRAQGIGWLCLEKLCTRQRGRDA